MSDDADEQGEGGSGDGTDEATDVPDLDDLVDVDGEAEDVSVGSTQAGDPKGSGEATGDTSPFDELAGSVESGDLDEVFEEAFDDVSAEVQTDDLWEELEGGETDRFEGAEEPAEVVSKRAFCEQCEHLSDPPAFRCTHEGTEILDFVDSDHVRVRDCPVVAQRRGVESE